jgi:hypothetical protein
MKREWPEISSSKNIKFYIVSALEKEAFGPELGKPENPHIPAWPIKLLSATTLQTTIYFCLDVLPSHSR